MTAPCSCRWIRGQGFERDPDCQTHGNTLRDRLTPPDRSAEHIADLHLRLRAFLLATMPFEAPDAIAVALLYEAVSITASVASSEAAARDAIRLFFQTGEDQIARCGVGKPHP